MANLTAEKPAEKQPQTLALPLRELTLHDSCDRCGVSALQQESAWQPGEFGDAVRIAQAKVLVILKDGSELLFCKHHFEDHELALLTLPDIQIVDHRDTLNEKPGFSA